MVQEMDSGMVRARETVPDLGLDLDLDSGLELVKALATARERSLVIRLELVKELGFPTALDFPMELEKVRVRRLAKVMDSVQLKVFLSKKWKVMVLVPAPLAD